MRLMFLLVSGWREGGGSTLEAVVGMEGVVFGFSKGRGYIAASFSFTTPRPPFKGGISRCAPTLLCFVFVFVCKWSLNVTKSSPT